MSFQRNLTPVASPVVAVCLPKRILSQNNAKNMNGQKMLCRNPVKSDILER